MTVYQHPQHATRASPADPPDGDGRNGDDDSEEEPTAIVSALVELARWDDDAEGL